MMCNTKLLFYYINYRKVKLFLFKNINYYNNVT